MAAAAPIDTRAAPAARAAIAVPGLIFGVLAALPLAGLVMPANYLLDFGTRIMIFAIAAVALDLIVGYGALVSFGHAAFIGLGAYAVGILAAHGIGEVLVSLPTA
ncbi:MAG TPA: branched-chain amino acid ABC transporter permease, partial [Xanthobacteraceae bacterium]|nr:branched-chain amino acid ABC transporter permease [Xanthobacteraceae bacterium]